MTNSNSDLFSTRVLCCLLLWSRSTGSIAGGRHGGSVGLFRDWIFSFPNVWIGGGVVGGGVFGGGVFGGGVVVGGGGAGW